MQTFWTNIPFRHSCGREGNMVKLLINHTGIMSIEGKCPSCGEEFEIEENVLNLVAKCPSIEELLISQDSLPFELNQEEVGFEIVSA